MQLANHKNKAETLIYLEQEAFELNSVRAAPFLKPPSYPLYY